jgi:cytochrome b6-f complex iron-sulfur subunit
MMKALSQSKPSGAIDPSRRHFLFMTGTISAAAGLVGFLAATFRYLFPNVLYEPPSRFPIGRPDDFPPGTPTFLAEQRLFVFNSPAGFYAISSVCTHLGCNVNYASEHGFECPCHGSHFDKNGQVIQGPAPRPLSWFGLSLSPRGELVVDERRLVAPDYRFKV